MPFKYETTNGVRHETQGASTTTSLGTTLTAAASANTKGTYSTVGSSTSFDYEAITVYFYRNSASANYTIDLAVQISGGNHIKAADLRFDGFRVANGRADVYYLPIHIPSGSQLSARCQSSSASATCQIIVIGHSRGRQLEPGFSRCFAISTATLSRGITLLATTGANTEGAQSILTTNCPRASKSIMVHIGLDADTARTAAMSWLVDVGWGTATNNIIWHLTNMFSHAETTLDLPYPIVQGIFAADIATGDKVSARMQTSSTATADSRRDIFVWGFE